MSRYWRLYLSFLRFSLANKLQFRFDFFFKIAMDGLFYLVNIAFYKTIFLHTPVLGGLNEQQALIFVGAFLTVDALYMCFFSANMWFLPQHINTGGLDFYLLRPVSSLFMLCLREFSWDSFVNFCMAITFLSYEIYTYNGLTFQRILLFALCLLIGTYLNFLIQLVFIFPAFWTGSPRGFSNLNWTLQEFYEKPDRIFKGVLRYILLTILPFSLFASVPVKALFEQTIWVWPLHLAVVTFLFQMLVRKLWARGLRVYSSASS